MKKFKTHFILSIITGLCFSLLNQYFIEKNFFSIVDTIIQTPIIALSILVVPFLVWSIALLTKNSNEKALKIFNTVFYSIFGICVVLIILSLMNPK